MFKRISSFSLYSVLALIGIISSVISAGAVTLDQELTTLINSHPLVSSHQQKVLAADAQINVAKDNSYPVVDLSTEVGQQKYKDTGAGTDSDLNNNRYSVSITQNLFRGFKDQAKENEAKTKHTIAETTLSKTIQRLAFEASTTYLAALHYNGLSDRIKENVNLSRQFVKKREEQRDSGAGNDLNVYNAHLTLQRSLEQQLIIDGRKRLSSGKYQRVFFHEPEYSDMEKPPSINEYLPATLSEAVSIARQNNVSISIANDRVNQARYVKEGAHGDYWPSLDMKASYNYERNYQGVEGSKKDTRVDLKLNWKLNLGNQVGDKFRSADSNFNAEKYSYQAELKNVDKNVNQAWEQFQTLSDRSKLSGETVKIAEKLYQASLELKQKGSGSDMSLLNAEVRLLDTQIALMNAQHEVINASYGLGYVCGLLSPELFGKSYVQKVMAQ